MIKPKCDHNPFAGDWTGQRWRNIRTSDTESDLYKCGNCHAIINRTLDLINHPVKYDNVSVEISGWSPTAIIIRKDDNVIDWIEVQDEGGYEGSYNVHTVRVFSPINAGQFKEKDVQ